MDATDPVIDLLEELRPQPYGLVRTDRIANPIVEPQWVGLRVLAAVEDRSVALRDEAGEPFTERPEVDRALGSAVRAGSAIFDGFLTKQPTADIVYATPSGDVPSPGALMAKPFIGMRRDRGKEAEAERAALAEAATFREEDQVAFVATDLLRVDGDSLLDVPLLERKRLLDSVIDPAELVRVGAYVRPPLETVDRHVAAARVPWAVFPRRQLPLSPGREARRLDPRPDASALTHRREAATVASCPPRS